MFRVPNLYAISVFFMSLWLNPMDTSNFSEFSENLEDFALEMKGAERRVEREASGLLTSSRAFKI